MNRRSPRAMLALVALPLLTCPAFAQLAVSANDGKAVLVNGVSTVPDSPAPDYAAIVDLGTNPPKVIGEVPAPASVVGPPQSVAIARDESIALVTGAFKVDPSDRKKTVPDDRVTVIDLKARPPAVLATVQAGKGASGVSISPDSKLALVANRSEGTVSIFTIADRKLTPAGKIDFGNDKSGPSHVAFTPDGKRALVSRDGDHKISVLAIDGSKVEYTKRDMVGGIRPYSLEISAKGDVAVVGNQGGGQGDNDVINVIDLKVNPPRIVDTISVGPTPEGVAMSPDGAYVAVTVMNGSNRPKDSPFFNDYGWLKVYSIKGTKLTPVAETKVGHWCQGAVWRKDNKAILVQCMVEKQLQIYSFDGKRLKSAGTVALKAGPAGIRTAGK